MATVKLSYIYKTIVCFECASWVIALFGGLPWFLGVALWVRKHTASQYMAYYIPSNLGLYIWSPQCPLPPPSTLWWNQVLLLILACVCVCVLMWCDMSMHPFIIYAILYLYYRFWCSITCLCCKRKCFGVRLHVLKLMSFTVVKLNCPVRDD